MKKLHLKNIEVLLKNKNIDSKLKKDLENKKRILENNETVKK